jgi:DNA repair exonuclease SbcCD ATPase subunit
MIGLRPVPQCVTLSRLGARWQGKERQRKGMDSFNEAIDRLIRLHGELAQSQARTAADLQLLTGKVLELTETVARLESQMDKVNGAIDHLTGLYSEVAQSQARTAADLQLLTGKVLELTETVARLESQTASDLQLLTSKLLELTETVARLESQTASDLQLLTGKLLELTETVARLESQAEVDRAEIREAINNLIVANEVTRKLSEDVARLAIQTSQRVSGLESRMSNLESKQ